MLATTINHFRPDIPAAEPALFATLIAPSLADLSCVVTGARYYRGLELVSASTSIMTVLRREGNWRFFLIGTIAFPAEMMGHPVRRRRCHGRCTAFSIDNGPRLSHRDRLPIIAFRVGPTLIGVPLILRALARYRSGPYSDQAAGAPHHGTDHATNAPPIMEGHRAIFRAPHRDLAQVPRLLIADKLRIRCDAQSRWAPRPSGKRVWTTAPRNVRQPTSERALARRLARHPVGVSSSALARTFATSGAEIRPGNYL